MIFNPHKYQEKAINHIINSPKCGLFLDMGLGKTVSTLTAIKHLKYDYFEIDKALVIAPLKVAKHTWSEEIKKWRHLNGLTVSKIIGTPNQRREALSKEADIYLTNRENTEWLCNEVSSFGYGFNFDLVVIDEISSFKNWKSRRFKALKKYMPGCKRVIGLTGTPAPNGLLDLWSQMYLLDQGKRLGATVTEYKERYFKPDKRNGATIFSYKIKEPNVEDEILINISDICISMEAKDWLDMPDKIINVQKAVFSDREKNIYNKFEKEQYLKFVSSEITALSKASLINKLLQFSNGAVYDSTQGYTITSNAKLEELESLIESSNSKPILCFYSYKHDFERIQKKFKFAKKLKIQQDIDDWNKGSIPLLLCHPASAGHGLNLQYGGNIIVWFGLTWSLELYEQANARLYRQGQTESVIIHHILTEGTQDQKVLDSLQGKKDVQDNILKALKYKYSV